MSDVSQGPDWWQASDGKWYAPELHPDQSPTAPQEPFTAAEPSDPPTAPLPTGGFPPPGPPDAPPPWSSEPPPTASQPPPWTPASASSPGGPPGGGPPPYTPAKSSSGPGPALWIALAVGIVIIAGVVFLVTRDSGGGSVSSFCDEAEKLKNDTSLDNAFSDPAKIDDVVAKFNALTDAAPSEIKNDVKLIDDALKKVADAIKAAGSDPDEQLSAVFAVIGSLNQNDFEAAGSRVEEFAQRECGFSLSDNSTSDFSSDFSSFTDFSTSDFSSFSDFSTSDFSFSESDFTDFFSSLSDFTDFSEFSDFGS